MPRKPDERFWKNAVPSSKAARCLFREYTTSIPPAAVGVQHVAPLPLDARHNLASQTRPLFENKTFLLKRRPYLSDSDGFVSCVSFLSRTFYSDQSKQYQCNVRNF